MQSISKPLADSTQLNSPNRRPSQLTSKMAATPVSHRTQAQSPSHGEQGPARHPSEDQGLCDRCQEWDLDELYSKLTGEIEPFETICDLETLHENCRLCRMFAESYRYDSSVVSAMRDLRLMAVSYHYAHEIVPHDYLGQDTWSPARLLCVSNRNNFWNDRAFITMSLERLGDASDPRVDGWGRQPCNVSWLAKCMRECAEIHQECHAGPAQQFDAPVYFIDCDSRRLCKAAPGMPYTALSYVWGKGHPDDKTVGLGSSIALPAPLPLTIENAMALTRQLGMQYLWVDRYCITNSDEQSAMRHAQLSTMDQIYSQAEVTIVSLGDGPHAGLPGVDGTPRWIRPWETIRGYTFRTTFREPRHVILESKWNERGWTYQEAYLSRRKIYFTPEEAIFECSMAFHSEIKKDCVSPIKPSQSKGPPILGRAPLLTTTGISLDLSALRDHVAIYHLRKLTYQSDVLNAFKGVIGKFERGPCAIQHYWGLPIYEHSVEMRNEKMPLMPPKLAVRQQHGSTGAIQGASMASMFAASLTWHFWIGNACRRRSGFPSWSWTGWEMTDCSPTYKSSNIGDVHIWIELINGETLPIDEFSSAGAFNLPPSQISPYIHIECLTTPVQIGKRMTYRTIHGHSPVGEGEKHTCVEFQSIDGLPVVCIPNIPEKNQFAEETNCKVIVVGEPAAEDRGLGFIMVVKEKVGFYERIGSSTHYIKDKWAVKRADGKWIGTELFEIPNIIFKREKIRLG